MQEKNLDSSAFHIAWPFQTRRAGPLNLQITSANHINAPKSLMGQNGSAALSFLHLQMLKIGEFVQSRFIRISD